MRKKLCYFLVSALTTWTIAGRPAYASGQEIRSIDNCFSDQIGTSHALSATGNCPVPGSTGSALADLASDELGAFASSAGIRSADAYAFMATNLYFEPNQVVTVTATMKFTGSVIGDPGSGPHNNSFLFQAAVDNYFLFGVTGSDSRNGFLVTANAESGMDGYGIVSATGSFARNMIDVTLTETSTAYSGADGLSWGIGGYIEAQVVPAFPGASTVVDFLDPATVTFSVPAGTRFTSEGFLQASPRGIPEPSTWVAIVLGFTALGLLGYCRARPDRAAHAAA
jgi:hypothetical protein